MCLGVPGQIQSIEVEPGGMTTGIVNFGGITKKVCLAFVPEAHLNDYVIVHVGFAISKVDEEEARLVFQYLEQMEELAELHLAQPN
jgi:hydrogenase expression/formation protein HypC